MPPLLEARELSRRFGGLVAVDKVSLAVEPLTVTALIGPNGAGKTTFFKMLAGELQPTSGDVFFKDKRITKLNVTRVAQLGIAKSFQITQIFPKLTVEENLLVPALAATRGSFRVDALIPLASAKGAHEIAERVLQQIDLGDRRRMRASELSYGEKRRLELGLALATQPEVLLLDEPTAGMSPTERTAMVELLEELRKTVTIVIVEHDMDVVFGLADRVFVLQDGRPIAEGTPAEIRGHPKVQEAYLGTGGVA
ncbi:MAG: ABC transporter ATP-binding protein [Candidatus Eremiobacteraeota bacterium]|nr:ABC transporter ATP-binding protein [Candidatus Eremiobacteraeota bacterium]